MLTSNWQGFVAVLGMLALADLVGVFVLWLLGLLPEHGIWAATV